ncbi:MAG: tRNA lysidine(34) synthetase TilS [Arcanobacterium sp.]|nr:tRNA lysidine(34) synthetase TilS [Arcanobacterium sp.]MDY5589585.1 tRNA lysidine(34) synthetase TilS [Arcanobacterium sp.]
MSDNMAHPHPLVSQARHALQRAFSALPIGAHVLLAVSGGADSMALALGARYAARERAIALHSLTVDHGLRPESASEAAAVRTRLEQLGIAARIATVSVEHAGGGQGPEGAARVVRYRALAEEAVRIGQEYGDLAAPVFLGHNADDQAETVLLGLARGSGARSIAGMPESGRLPGHPEVPMVRPLLSMRRAELRTVCRELGVKWEEDPTNQLDSEWRAADGSALRRSALRYQVIPLLEEVLGAGVVPALVRTGALVAADDAALMESARAALTAAQVAKPEAEEPREVPLVRRQGENELSAARLAERAVHIGGENGSHCSVMSETDLTMASEAHCAVVRIDCAILAAYPQAVRTRSVRLAALAVGARGGELFFSHISALDKLVTGRENNIHIDLPGAHATKCHGVLEIAQGTRRSAAPQQKNE